MKLKDWHKTLLIVAFYILAIALNMYSGRVLIPELYPNRPILPDIVLDHIPYFEPGKYIMDYAQILLVVPFIYLCFKTKFKDLNRYLFALALILFLRGLTIVLNPVEQAWIGFDNRLGELYANIISDVNGYFFSGHTATMVMLTIITAKMDRKMLWYGIAVTLIVVASMLLSRNHYTMDVYGGLVTALLVGYILKILPLERQKEH